MTPKYCGKSKREPCEYCVDECAGKNIIGDETSNVSVYLDFGYLTSQAEVVDETRGSYSQILGTKINYCPMCGRKLEEAE